MNRFRSITMMNTIKTWLSYPLFQRLVWVLFAILFYQSGLSFTRYILDTDYSAGVWQWAGIIAFPFLLVAFFFINRYLGCAGNQCPLTNQANQANQAKQPTSENNKHALYFRPPG